MCEPEMRDECRTMLAELREDVRGLPALTDEVRMIRRAVVGNGDSDKSLLTRVGQHGLALKIIGAAVVAIAVILPGIVIALAKFLGAIGN